MLYLKTTASYVYIICYIQVVYVIILGYNTAMVCRGPELAHLRQYWPEGFSPRANASEGVPIWARCISFFVRLLFECELLINSRSQSVTAVTLAREFDRIGPPGSRKPVFGTPLYMPGI